MHGASIFVLLEALCVVSRPRMYALRTFLLIASVHSYATSSIDIRTKYSN